MGEQKKIQWHPGFAAAIRIELKDNSNDLEFKEEYNLSKKPLQIDLLIIKNDKRITIQNKIGKLFKRYNILEYKSPDDEMSVDALYKIMAYACLYKTSGGRENEYKANDITITLIRQRYPKTLIHYLEEEGYEIKKKYDGVYYVIGKTMFDMQIIVSKELDSSKNIWLHSLQNDISQNEYQQLLLSVNGLSSKDKEEYGDAVLEVVSRANISNIRKWKEESEMCATLEEVMAPELEAKKKEGRVEGKILMCYELGHPLKSIAERFSLSIETVEKIITQQ